MVMASSMSLTASKVTTGPKISSVVSGPVAGSTSRAGDTRPSRHPPGSGRTTSRAWCSASDT